MRYTPSLTPVAFKRGDYKKELKQIEETVNLCLDLGLGCNAGHDLTHTNLPPLLEVAPDIAEVSIGHHIITYALEVGIEQSVKAHLEALGH